jgi:hypothetical protein
MYTNSWDPNNGQIMRSSDYGKTWSVTTLPFKVGGNMPGRGLGEVCRSIVQVLDLQVKQFVFIAPGNRPKQELSSLLWRP